MYSNEVSYRNNNNNQNNFPLENDRKFYPVGGKHIERMDILSEIFNRILIPLYGNQDKAIAQIKESKDRKCYLLYEGNTPSGVLAYKTIPSDEFAEFGVKNSIEIKSLFVDHSLQNSGRGLGSTLIDKLKDKVAKMGSKLDFKPDGIHVTVSETKVESLSFFRKKGFDVAHAWKSRYMLGVTEYLLYCPLKIKEVNKELQDSQQKLSALKLSTEFTSELIHTIHNAHFDDIHALKLLSDGTFISGSKDNSLRKWDKSGNLITVVYDVEPTLQSERDWVTAVEVINDEYWVSGERSGRIFLWKTNGEYVKEIKLKLPRGSKHISQSLNALRVNCFASGLNPNKPSLFVGLPTMFDEYNLIEGRTEFCKTVHNNDWVYCVHPVSQTKVFAVIGCAVKAFDMLNEEWTAGDVILPEPQKVKSSREGKPFYQRQFISSFIPLKSSKNHFGLAVFGGFVKVLDAESKKIIQSWKEHEGRVWSLENTSLNTFASSGEDKTVKIWDARIWKNSVRTIDNHIGQVTSLMKLDDNTLVAGTCPEKGVISKESAEIKFYDLRA